MSKEKKEEEKQDPVFEVGTSILARNLRGPILALAEEAKRPAKFHLPVGGVAVNPYKLYVQTAEEMKLPISQLPGVATIGVTTDKTQTEQPPPVLAVATPKLENVPKPPAPSPYSTYGDQIAKNWEETK
jgi:hypothetical protein